MSKFNIIEKFDAYPTTVKFRLHQKWLLRGTLGGKQRKLGEGSMSVGRKADKIASRRVERRAKLLEIWLKNNLIN